MKARTEFQRLETENKLLRAKVRQLRRALGVCSGMLEDIDSGVCWTSRDIERALAHARGFYRGN